MSGILHIIDFEGTRAVGVFELGMVRMHGGVPVAGFSALCRPRRPVPREELALCRLRPASLAGADPFSSHWERLVAARSEGPFGAHGAGTEHGLLVDAFPFPPTSPDPRPNFPPAASWGPWVDTLRIARQLRPGLPGYSLDHLILSEGIGPELEKLAAVWCPTGRAQRHAALYDAIAAALLLTAWQRSGLLRSPVDWFPAEANRQQELF